MSMPQWYSDWIHGAVDVAARSVFFIGGCQKSGTTWVQHLLNGHPEVACHGEGHVTDGLIPHLQGAMNAYNKRQGERSAELGLLLGEPDLLGAARCLSDAMLARALAAKPNPAAVRAVGDKTPEHALNLVLLLRLYEQPRFLHVVRDGRDAAVSGYAHLERTGKLNGQTAASYARFFADHHWVKMIKLARQAGRALGPRFLEIRYEDLHAEPESTIRTILEWLDVDAGDEAVDSCRRAGTFKRLSGGRDRGEEDRSSFFRRGVVGSWRDEMPPDAVAEFERSAGDLLAELGYDLSETVAAPAAR